MMCPNQSQHRFAALDGIVVAFLLRVEGWCVCVEGAGSVQDEVLCVKSVMIGQMSKVWGPLA